MDLKFPHHECEIAQGRGLHGQDPVRYWMHSNMLTVNGQKMSKSLNNSFLPRELFSGNHPLLDQAFSPMTVRFFMLQSHYRSTLDFSNEALRAAQKGYRKLATGVRIIKMLEYTPEIGVEEDPSVKEDISQSIRRFYDAMNDDINTAVAIAQMFNLLKYINMLYTGQLKFASVGEDTYNLLENKFIYFFHEILGLVEEKTTGDSVLIGMLNLYKEYKAEKKYEKVDEIRAYFKNQGLVIRDMKHRVDWAYDE
jgi:cysteinyl-tRNA synthetase